jgi:multidrug efflux pump subunit AcrA (membrane-fusion protein)
VNLSNREKHLFPNQGFQRMVNLKKLLPIFSVAMLSAVLMAAGCSYTQAKQPSTQPLRVKTETIDPSPVPHVDEYVATVKSRRSAGIQPQVDGPLTRILKVINV